MPPKKNISQKQKQKKAKQQQQQQQNIKINVRVGDSRKRAPRKSSGKKQPPRPPPNVPVIQQAPYIPMFLNQQPAQYFTPPVASTTLPITPPTTITAPITTTATAPAPTIIPLPRTRIPSPRTSIPIPISPPTRPSSSSAPTITRAIPAPSIELDTFTNFGPSQNAISNLVGFTDLDEPTPFSFGNRSTFYSAIDEFNDYADFGTQTDTIPQPPLTFIRRAGTQTDESPTFIRRAGTQTTPSPIGQSDIETQFEPAFTIAYQNELATQTEPTFQREFETQTIPTVAINAETQTGRRYVSSTESQTAPIVAPSLRDFGTQFEEFMPQVPDIIPTAVSSTLREMETQTDKFIPRPPPLPPTMPSFIAPTQDIQPSSVQSIVNLTQENLAKFGGLSSVMPRGVSEISDITEGTSRSINTDISNFIQQEAMRMAGSRAPIEETLKQQKEESKKRSEDSGIVGQMKREMDKRRQFIQPQQQEDDDDEWDDEPKQPARQKVGGKMKVKQEEISQLEQDTKMIIDRYENDIEERNQNIEFWRNQIRNMEEMGIKRDFAGLTVDDYEREIGDAEEAISFYESELESLKERIPSKSTEKQPEEEEVPSTKEIILSRIQNEINELKNRLDGAEVMKRTYSRKRIELVESGEDVDEDGYNVSRYDKLIENNKKEIKSIKQLKTRRENQLKKILGESKLAPIQEEDEFSFQPIEEEGIDIEFEE